MTARQRAMYDRGGEMAIAVEEQLMSLPSGKQLIDLEMLFRFYLS